MTKVMDNIQDALSFVESGHTVLVGGFGLIGAPLSLIDGLTEKEVKDLTIVSNNLGESGKGLGILLNQNKIKKALVHILQVIGMLVTNIKKGKSN